MTLLSEEGREMYTVYQVTFVVDEETEATYVNSGSTLSQPTDLSKEGYTLEGWYTDKACTEEYDFETAVTADITLYAKWTANSTNSGTNSGTSSGSTTYPPTVEQSDNGTTAASPKNPRQGGNPVPLRPV